MLYIFLSGLLKRSNFLENFLSYYYLTKFWPFKNDTEQQKHIKANQKPLKSLHAF